MHMGGGWANLVVRGDDPSAFGQGVSPVIDAPAATGLSFTPAVVGVVERGAVVARKRPRGRPRKNPVAESPIERQDSREQRSAAA